METVCPHGQLVGLHIADNAEAWSRAGFDVRRDTVHLDGISIHLDGDAGETRGITAWTLHGVSTDLDGLVTAPGVQPFPAGEGAPHPNGIATIDHVVVQTDDFGRTLPVFASAGLELRRTRTFAFDGVEQQQCFFWLGSTILELVGPAMAAMNSVGPASFWGLAITTPDLDATVASLGELATPPKPAVQKGRRISTLKTRDLDISVPVALMSPHVPRLSEGEE